MPSRNEDTAVTDPSHQPIEGYSGDPGARPYDAIVVGGGAAGLGGALLLARARLRVAVVDAGNPRNAPAAHMHGFLSRDGMPPAELRAAGRAEVLSYGAELIEGTVESVLPGFRLRLAGGSERETRWLLVTTGMRDELPLLPGLAERWGRDVIQCPYCHGYEVRDEPIGVLSTQPASVRQALLVREWSADVVFFEHVHPPTAAERRQLSAQGIRIVPGEVSELVVGADGLSGVRVAGEPSPVRRSALFVSPRFVPATEALVELGCETDEQGHLVVDELGATTVPRLWAAGNVVNPKAQVLVAAGAGAAAAMAMHGEMVQERARLALPAA
jgi:thioredoxin reductase